MLSGPCSWLFVHGFPSSVTIYLGLWLLMHTEGQFAKQSRWTHNQSNALMSQMKCPRSYLLFISAKTVSETLIQNPKSAASLLAANAAALPPQSQCCMLDPYLHLLLHPTLFHPTGWYYQYATQVITFFLGNLKPFLNTLMSGSFFVCTMCSCIFFNLTPILLLKNPCVQKSLSFPFPL